MEFHFLSPICTHPVAELTKSIVDPDFCLISGFSIMDTAGLPVDTVATYAGCLAASMIDFINEMHRGNNARAARLRLLPALRVAIFLKSIAQYLHAKRFQTSNEIFRIIGHITDTFVASLATLSMYRSVLYIVVVAAVSAERAALKGSHAYKTALWGAIRKMEYVLGGSEQVWPSLRDPMDLVRGREMYYLTFLTRLVILP